MKYLRKIFVSRLWNSTFYIVGRKSLNNTSYWNKFHFLIIYIDNNASAEWIITMNNWIEQCFSKCFLGIVKAVYSLKTLKFLLHSIMYEKVSSSWVKSEPLNSLLSLNSVLFSSANTATFVVCWYWSDKRNPRFVYSEFVLSFMPRAIYFSSENLTKYFSKAFWATSKVKFWLSERILSKFHRQAIVNIHWKGIQKRDLSF